MKLIEKIEINPEKVLNEAELSKLQGGVKDPTAPCCKCTDGIAMAALSAADCEDSCNLYGQHGIWSC